MSNDFVRTGAVDVNKKIDAEKLSLDGLEIFRLRTSSGPTSIRLDQVDANTAYVGEAAPGADDSASVWRIRKMLTVGNVLSILYANGNSDFTNAWANRNSLTYS